MLNVETVVKTKIRLSGRQNMNKIREMDTVYKQNSAWRNLRSCFPLTGSDVMLRHGLLNQNVLNTS